ncbi:MAG: caspase family protein [Magnetospirillum sp.]|nr:caspase family protein [Magnetospirillum sp.]
MRRGYLLLLCLLAAGPSQAAEERRVALIIGNGSYKDASLKNPPNDARAMARTLKGLGFDVLEHTNLDNRSMNRAITAFGEKLRGGGVGLFFYGSSTAQVDLKRSPSGAAIR